MTPKPKPPIPSRAPGRPRSPRGGINAEALRVILAARGLTGAWLVARMAAEGAAVDRRRIYGWMRGADIAAPDAGTIKAMASILGVSQRQLRDVGE